MKIFDIFTRKKRVRDEYMDAQNRFLSRWARPPSMNTAEWLDMFTKSPRLAVVDRIASDVANIKGHLYKINENGTETELTNHPFLDFMQNPNPLYEMTSSAVWRLHEIYLLLVGESFFLIERDNLGRPTELWNVPPHWVKMTPHLDYPYYDIISTNGITMSIPVDDMFVMKHLNPLDPFLRGAGVAESIADEVEIDEYAAKFQKRFFYNDATPPVVFLMPDATPTQRDEFMARWNNRHKGVENSHSAAALTGNVDVKVIGSTSGQNLDFIDSRIAMRDAVLEHFGVPREIMGITENSNRATADSAQYIYAKNVLTPRLLNREEAINKQLLPMFGDNLVWHFDVVIPYDKDFDKAKALDGFNAGLMTKNEARSLLDLPDIEGGDVFKVSMNDMFMQKTDDPAKFSQAMFETDLSAADDVFGQKAARHINIGAMLKLEDVALRENERLFEVAITRHFADQQREISSVLGLSSKADGVSVFEELDEYLLPDGTFDLEKWAALTVEQQQLLTVAVANNLLNWRDEAKKLTELFTPLWKTAYEAGADVNKVVYGLTGIERPEFVSAAKLNGGKRVVGIQQTTRDNIAKIISDGVANGTSQANLKKEIQTEMGSAATAARAKLIARQETSTALATGQYEMMVAAGATNKTWKHRPQKNPRDGTHGQPNHVAMDGETVRIDERFSNGLRYPRDPEDDRPEELINCRCYLVYGGF